MRKYPPKSPILADMTDASWMERSALIALLAASLALFWLRFRKVLAAIRGSRATPDFELAPLGPRIRQFLWEVMAQGKVIGQRPLPGIAHAFVFWGFCAFALVTLNHLASPFGARFLSGETAFGRFYFGFVAVWAVAVAVAITGLFIRRFLVRPVWLGELSPESGVVALLIFLLMATYLCGLWLPPVTLAGKANWWAHTLALAIFLPLIPCTKHLHLALSPVTVFLRRAGFSRIPPLAGDEDFGLGAGTDITRIDALQACTCVECGRCTEHCPAYRTGKVLNPKEIILGLRGYLDQFGPAGQAALLGGHISEEAVFQCTTCGACEFQCPVGIQHLPVIVGLRRGAVNTGQWQDEHGARLFLNLERNGNALGFPAGERQNFIEKNGLPIYDGTQAYCLWLGCMGAYDPQGREIVLALARVLRHAGVTFGVLRKEKCTGDPARRLGNDLAVSQLAEANIQTLRAAGGLRGALWARQDGFHLPALRAHHRRRLAGVRRHVRDRASQRAVGPFAVETGRGALRESGLPRPLLSGPIPQRIRPAAPGDRAFRRCGGTAPRARAFLLLRCRRWPDVPGRGEGQAHQRGARRRAGGLGRADDRHGLSVLPVDVPRRPRRAGAGAAEAAGHRADRGGGAAGGAAENRIVTYGRAMV